MFKLLKNNKGQGATIQYALTFFFIVAAVTGMTVYFKRTLQGRIRDATFYMGDTVGNVYNGRIVRQYEPYYMVSGGDRSMEDTRAKALLGSFNSASGIYTDKGRTVTRGKLYSNQERPGLAD